MSTEIETAVETAVGEAITTHFLVSGLLTTIIAIVTVLVIRFFIVKLVKGKSDTLDQDQRRWINKINNGATLLSLLCLMFLWAPQLHTFALSMTAVAMAVVWSTKELLMCLTGGFLRTTTKPFDVGDWITVDGQTGEVMRVTTLATVIEEVTMVDHSYQFTGRTLHIPNSKFLTNTVTNADFTKDYAYSDIPITLHHTGMDPVKLTKQLYKITEKHFAPFRDEAVKQNAKARRKSGVNYTAPEPQVFLSTTSKDALHTYTVRLFLPTLRAKEISTQITTDFLSYVYKPCLEKRKE